VVLACGGFQANAAMMRKHFGEGGDAVPLLAPRAHFNSGDGIRMAQALVPTCPASSTACTSSRSIRAAKISSSRVALSLRHFGRPRRPSVVRRGCGLVHETWEYISRHLHFSTPGRQDFAILDSRVRAIPDWQRATRSEVPPFRRIRLANWLR